MELEAFKTKYRVFTVIMAVLVILAGVWLWGYHVGSSSTDNATVTKTETVTTTKTTAPNPVAARQAGVVTVPVRLEAREPAEAVPPDGGIVVFPTGKDSLDSQNSLDSGFVARVAIEQKEYKDSNYTAWVSGFMPKLDSIEVRSKVITIRETTTKRSRLNVGLTGGVGYGVFTKKPDVWVGVGVTWNLFR